MNLIEMTHCCTNNNIIIYDWYTSVQYSPSTLNIFDFIANIVSDGDTVISKAVPVRVSTKTSIVGWLGPSSWKLFDLFDSLSGYPCCDISHAVRDQNYLRNIAIPRKYMHLNYNKIYRYCSRTVTWKRRKHALLGRKWT